MGGEVEVPLHAPRVPKNPPSPSILKTSNDLTQARNVCGMDRLFNSTPSSYHALQDDLTSVDPPGTAQEVVRYPFEPLDGYSS